MNSLNFSLQDKRFDILVDFEPGSTFPCPQCGRPAKTDDSAENSWRHLDFSQHATHLTARVQRCKYDEHGVKRVTVLWTRQGSGFTVLFEALVMALIREMPVNTVARVVGVQDTMLWRVVHPYVDAAVEGGGSGRGH